MSSVISLEGVSKQFGSTAALDQVSLQVPAACVYGFIGPNGAGKTTAIRLLFGLLQADSGRVEVLGHKLPEAAAKVTGKRIGGIIEEPVFYPFLTGKQNLQAFAAALDTKPDLDALLKRVGLYEAKDRKTKGYSLGMRQRLGIARALLGDPEILILDEPTNGLDPEGIISFRALVRHMAEQEGRTVFVSSHLLGELEQTCDQVAIIHKGKIVADGTVEELTQTTDTVRVETARGDIDYSEKITQCGARSVQAKDNGYLCMMESSDPADLARFNRALVEGGVPVSGFALQTKNLEESFLQILQDDQGEQPA